MEHFNLHDQNFVETFNAEFVNQLFNQYFSDHKEFSSDMELILGEIYVTYITLLLMNEKEKYALNIIDRAIQIC